MASFSLLSHASPFSSFFRPEPKTQQMLLRWMSALSQMCIKSKSVVAAVNKKGQSEHKTHKEKR